MQSNEKINREASLGTIEDADLAQQELNLLKQEMLKQSFVVRLAQANTCPDKVSSLLKKE